MNTNLDEQKVLSEHKQNYPSYSKNVSIVEESNKNDMKPIHLDVKKNLSNFQNNFFLMMICQI